MGLPSERLGAKFAADDALIDGERAKAYALATNDDNDAYASGKFAPPVFVVVPTWKAMVAAMEGIIPADAAKHVMHGERDLHFHRPLVPGTRLKVESEAFSWRVGSSGTRYTLRITSSDEDGKVVVEDYATMFIQKMSDGESAGPDKPDHAFVEAARPLKVGEHTVNVAADQTYRYRDASGDDMRIHIDDAFAKKVGLPGIILHGLATMAMVGQSVLRTVAGNDPSRLTRLAVRWAKPVFPGNDLTTSIYDAGLQNDVHVYSFESTSNGALVVSNGRVEIRPQ